MTALLESLRASQTWRDAAQSSSQGPEPGPSSQSSSGSSSESPVPFSSNASLGLDSGGKVAELLAQLSAAPQAATSARFLLPEETWDQPWRGNDAVPSHDSVHDGPPDRRHLSYKEALPFLATLAQDAAVVDELQKVHGALVRAVLRMLSPPR